MKLGSSEVLDEADVDPGTRSEDGDSLPQRLPMVIFELCINTNGRFFEMRQLVQSRKEMAPCSETWPDQDIRTSIIRHQNSFDFHKFSYYHHLYECVWLRPTLSRS